jgi:NTP pyrophosphatase (non-canonical NTP hydrolase)
MQLAPILHMNQELEQSDQHERSTMKDLKRQMDRLTGEVGRLVDAIQGNDMGNEGLIPRVQAIETQQDALKKRLDEMELEAKKRGMYIMAIVGLIGIVLGTGFKALIDKFSK